VFVDDAILGDLPLVCAKTGKPADFLVCIRHTVGGGIPGWVWFLLFLGPVGVVALLLAALFCPGVEYLTVRIPETQASHQRERLLERWRLACLGAGVASPFLLGLAGAGMFPLMWLALTVAFFAAATLITWMLWRQSIGVSIDVTRRWVTFTNVHPAFAEAVSRKESLSRRYQPITPSEMSDRSR
jgi:MFS family permease